ncbi:hypothetical protein [Pleomorphomonas oryzae]|uniref:hypothetical protein n=1 Tax=Pleomorphomonas oryzae TaxID=261934 RepID=UPI00042A1730|nr:hypothetical protein [Pleomorphomonas oryzae]
MKTMILPTLGALIALALASPAHAEGKSKTIFSCAIGKRTASVTLADGQLTYHFGTRAHDELTIVGTPASGNVFQMAQRYAGMEYQLRFKSDDYSYILYAAEGNPQVGAAANSGLVILQGTDRIADRSCAKFTEFAVPLDGLGIPEDTEDYSAM